MNELGKCNPTDCRQEMERMGKKLVELEGFIILMMIMVGPMFIIFMSSLGHK